MMRMISFTIIFSVILQVPVFAANEIHVSTKGNDKNAGTSVQPIQSLKEALNRLAALHQKKTKANIDVILHAGTHYINEPLIITPKHMLAGDFKLTFKSAASERPVVSGGMAITSWKESEEGVITASLANLDTKNLALRELFVNGKRCVRARHPNKGYFRIEKAGEDKRTSVFVKDGDLPKNISPDTELVFLHDWSISRVPVKSFNAKTNQLVVKHNIGCKADHYKIDHFEKQPRYYLEGDASFLDQPGEWHWDGATKTLTYRLRPGEDVSNIKAIVPAVDQLLIVQGGKTNVIRNLHLQGLTFAHAQWQLPPGGYASGQATVHEYRNFQKNHSSRKMMKSAITFEHAAHCSMIDCRVTQLGLSGVLFGAHTHHCRIEGNLFEDISGNSINIGEDGSRRVKGKTWWQSAPQTGASDHVIANNLIQDCGVQFFGAVGVWVGLANNVHIHHNEIRHLPYTGVSLGWMWNPTKTNTGGHKVEFNHIHHIMQTLSDGGGIYTLGRQPGTVLRNNHIHDIPLNAGRAESNGMFLDQGSHLITIEGNLIHDLERSPLRFHQAVDVLVKNNILVNAKGIPTLRFNNTNPKTIKSVGNTTMSQAAFANEFRELQLPQIDQARVEAEYRKRLGLE